MSESAFADRIKFIMEQRELSQSSLAELIGVSQPTVWGWLNGSVPQKRTIELMCEKLDLSTVWLQKGVGQPSPYRSGKKIISLKEEHSLTANFDERLQKLESMKDITLLVTQTFDELALYLESRASEDLEAARLLRKQGQHTQLLLNRMMEITSKNKTNE